MFGEELVDLDQPTFMMFRTVFHRLIFFFPLQSYTTVKPGTKQGYLTPASGIEFTN